MRCILRPRFVIKAMVLSAARDEGAIKIAVRRIGPALVFERLWEKTGCGTVIRELAGKRKRGFMLERAGVPQRVDPASVYQSLRFTQPSVRCG
jgi:hypothetical protein